MNRSFVALAAAIVFTAGCNTMQGVGKDISAGGDKVVGFLKRDQPADGSSINPPADPDPATTGSDTNRIPAAPEDSSAATPPSGTSTQ
jgi:predicted small secreted protein